MKRILIFLASFFVVFLFIFISCKGPEGEIGPTGEAGRDFDINNLWTSKEGFILGRATGTRLDGSTFAYNLDFRGNLSTSSNYYQISPTDTVIVVDKLYSGEGDYFTSGRIVLKLLVEDMATLGSPRVDEFSVYVEKDLGVNQFHRVAFDNTTAGASATVSNLGYNLTGALTGTYSVTLNASTDHGSFAISDSTFSTRIAEVIPRKAAQN